MKRSIFFALLFFASYFSLNAQTKKPTTTSKTTTTTVKKPAPKPTTTTKKNTTTTTSKTTVAKPTTTTTAPVTKPVEQAPAPAEVVKEPSGPPVTGPVNEGPKSYTNDSKSTTTTTNVSKSTSTKTTTKTVAPKPEKVKTTSDETVRSYIGIRGGYNLSTLEGVKDEIGTDGTVKNLAGYMGGVVINIGVNKVFSIQPEILYSQQGVEVGDGTNYVRGKLDIVNVPLLLKVAFGSPNFKFFINAGPYIGYALSAKSETNLNGVKTTTKIEFINEYDASGEKDNRIDFGGIGGAGIQFGVGNALLTLEGRYQYGMADPTLYKDGIPPTVPKNYHHQRVITGTVGLLFPIGRK